MGESVNPANASSPYPLGVVSPDAKVRHEIKAGLRAHEDLIFKFTEAWYRSPYTFLTTKVLGVPACKIPLDLWVMMDLFTQYRFETVIECGTAGGGATLWYATLMDLLKIDGRVISIDIQGQDAASPRPVHPRITYVQGSSVDQQTFARVMQMVAGRLGPRLVNLDSDHHAPHVLKELNLWAPYVPVGSWLVVEDTNGSPVVEDPITGEPHGVEGPYAALQEYLHQHPGEWERDVMCERFFLTMCPGGWLQRRKPYAERAR